MEHLLQQVGVGPRGHRGEDVAGEHPGAVGEAGGAQRRPRRLDECGPAEGDRLGGAVLDLLTAAPASMLGRAGSVPPDSRRRALLLRIHAFIEERLGDPACRRPNGAGWRRPRRAPDALDTGGGG